MTTPSSALLYRSAFQLCSKARLSQNSARNALTSRRTFRSSACQREQYLDANEETFKRAISAEASKGKVVLVDFYANWCGPCKMLSPILEKLTEPDNTTRTGSGKPVDLVTVNTDSEQNLAMKYSISALPTVIAFKDGEPLLMFTGARPEPGVKDFISKL